MIQFQTNITTGLFKQFQDNDARYQAITVLPNGTIQFDETATDAHDAFLFIRGILEGANKGKNGSDIFKTLPEVAGSIDTKTAKKDPIHTITTGFKSAYRQMDDSDKIIQLIGSSVAHTPSQAFCTELTTYNTNYPNSGLYAYNWENYCTEAQAQTPPSSPIAEQGFDWTSVGSGAAVSAAFSFASVFVPRPYALALSLFEGFAGTGLTAYMHGSRGSALLGAAATGSTFGLIGNALGHWVKSPILNGLLTTLIGGATGLSTLIGSHFGTEGKEETLGDSLHGFFNAENFVSMMISGFLGNAAGLAHNFRNQPHLTNRRLGHYNNALAHELTSDHATYQDSPSGGDILPRRIALGEIQRRAQESTAQHQGWNRTNNFARNLEVLDRVATNRAALQGHLSEARNLDAASQASRHLTELQNGIGDALLLTNDQKAEALRIIGHRVQTTMATRVQGFGDTVTTMGYEGGKSPYDVAHEALAIDGLINGPVVGAHVSDATKAAWTQRKQALLTRLDEPLEPARTLLKVQAGRDDMTLGQSRAHLRRLDDERSRLQSQSDNNHPANHLDPTRKNRVVALQQELGEVRNQINLWRIDAYNHINELAKTNRLTRQIENIRTPEDTARLLNEGGLQNAWRDLESLPLDETNPHLRLDAAGGGEQQASPKDVLGRLGRRISFGIVSPENNNLIKKATKTPSEITPQEVTHLRALHDLKEGILEGRREAAHNDPEHPLHELVREDGIGELLDTACNNLINHHLGGSEQPPGNVTTIIRIGENAPRDTTSLKERLAQVQTAVEANQAQHLPEPPTTPPGADDVLVRRRAASHNPKDAERLLAQGRQPNQNGAPDEGRKTGPLSDDEQAALLAEQDTHEPDPEARTDLPPGSLGNARLGGTHGPDSLRLGGSEASTPTINEAYERKFGDYNPRQIGTSDDLSHLVEQPRANLKRAQAELATAKENLQRTNGDVQRLEVEATALEAKTPEFEARVATAKTKVNGDTETIKNAKKEDLEIAIQYAKDAKTQAQLNLKQLTQREKDTLKNFGAAIMDAKRCLTQEGLTGKALETAIENDITVLQAKLSDYALRIQKTRHELADNVANTNLQRAEAALDYHIAEQALNTHNEQIATAKRDLAQAETVRNQAGSRVEEATQNAETAQARYDEAVTIKDAGKAKLIRELEKRVEVARNNSDNLKKQTSTAKGKATKAETAHVQLDAKAKELEGQVQALTTDELPTLKQKADELRKSASTAEESAINEKAKVPQTKEGSAYRIKAEGKAKNAKTAAEKARVEAENTEQILAKAEEANQARKAANEAKNQADTLRAEAEAAIEAKNQADAELNALQWKLSTVKNS